MVSAMCRKVHILVFFLLRQNNQHWQDNKSLFSSQFVEISVHNWLASRHSGMADVHSGHAMADRGGQKEQSSKQKAIKQEIIENTSPLSVPYTLSRLPALGAGSAHTQVRATSILPFIHDGKAISGLTVYHTPLISVSHTLHTAISEVSFKTAQGFSGTSRPKP